MWSPANLPVVIVVIVVFIDIIILNLIIDGY